VDARKEAQQLAIEVAETQKKLRKHDADMKAIDPQKFTFKDMMKAIGRTERIYENERNNSVTGKIRKRLCRLGDLAPSLEAWVKCLPYNQVRCTFPPETFS
jgi:hypothetical protein